MRKRVLWGHDVDEYQEMFDLADAMLEEKILEYGCGPSAFNASLHAQKQCVQSIDPLFSKSKAELEAEAKARFDERVQEVLKDPKQFNVEPYGGMDELFAKRRQGMKQFFNDYEQGLHDKRYLALTDEPLPFTDFEFDLALSSHFLFAASRDDDIEFHLKTLKSLARVAKDVRVFPLIEREGEPSPLLGPVLLGLQQANYGVEVREVECGLYPEGNAMLRVWAQECAMS